MGRCSRRRILGADFGVETGGFAPLFRLGFMTDKFSYPLQNRQQMQS